MARTMKGICNVCKTGPKKVPYTTFDGSGRICAACYRRSCRGRCSICGRIKLVPYRGPENNRKICSDCYRKQTGNYEGVCLECGKKGPIHYQGPKTRICRRCSERFKALDYIAGALEGKQEAIARLDALIISGKHRIRVREVLRDIFRLEVPRLKDGILLFCRTPDGKRLKVLWDKVKAGR